MKPTFSERQEIKKQCSKDVDRMLRCLEEAGLNKTDDEAILAWAEYSDDNCAGWLALPDDDAPLQAILLKYLTNMRSPAVWRRVTAVGAADGSGDLMIPLPSELSEQVGWKVGDELLIEKVDPDTFMLRRL
jgi:hypothetical protein